MTASPAAAQPAVNPFTDVEEGKYYTDAVLWAYSHEPQVTNGTSADKFSPDMTCTRGQVVTFLWRAAGCPEPKSLDNPFQDVASTAWYFKPVLWAVEQKITNGTAADKFSPEQTCSYAHVLTFLYRAAGSPNAENSPNRQWYHDALTWAVNNKFITGTGLEHTVYPTDSCPRCDVVTYLYRYYGSK
ncbi:MAG: S-layer homology domain-containing protein [Oscillospiraceae bacterium]|nr:S-layer homology domain-containing protein [Oscillospiraceae bacterium]